MKFYYTVYYNNIDLKRSMQFMSLRHFHSLALFCILCTQTTACCIKNCFNSFDSALAQDHTNGLTPC